MPLKKLRIRQKILFTLERQLVKGAQFQLLLVAAFIGLISLVGGLLVMPSGPPTSTFGESVWWAFLRLSDPGYLGDDEGGWRRFISTLITVAGYVVFLGSLVAIITTWMNRKIRHLEQGLTPVTANNHLLILGSTYGQHNWLFNLQSIASDESIVPFRGGTDWFDGGIFIEIHQHSWTPFHSTIRNVWSHLTQGVARASGAHQTLEEINGPERYLAEARAMGAFYNLHLLDLYGVSFEKLPEDVGTPELSRVLSGSEAVDFILNELDAAEPLLGTRAEVGSVRFSKAAAWGIKARLLLNKAVYTDRYASNFNFDAAAMTEIVNLTTQIINSGEYALETEDYFSIWNIDNHDHPEHIFAFDQRENWS